MRNKIVSLAAVAALALVGVGAATTTAQAASDEIKISEVLINTNKDANPLGEKIDGVEVVKPSSMSSLDGYKIQACSAPDAITGVSTLATVTNLDTLRDGQGRTASSNKLGTYDYDLDAALSRQGGVRLIDANGDVVDSINFNPAAAGVDTCLRTDNPNADPTITAAPTDISSPQRQNAGTSDDTGTFAPSAPPTFEPASGSENTIGD